MIVPKLKFHVPSEARGLGVPGQQASFKIPGGALSAGDTAAGALAVKVSNEAGQWAATAYETVRKLAVAEAVAEARAKIDLVFTDAQKQNIVNEKYPTEGGILGYFDEKINEILKGAGSSRDPFTNSRIRAKLVPYAGSERRTLANYNAGRLVNQAQAQLASDRALYVLGAGNALPHDWDGNYETLPTDVKSYLIQAERDQNAAAALGIIKATQAEEANRTLREEVAMFALTARVNAATTPDEIDDLRTILADTDMYRWLKVADRQSTIGKLNNDYREALTLELKVDDRRYRDNKRMLAEAQHANEFSIYDKYFEAIRTNSATPTVEDVLAIAGKNNGRGLRPGQTAALIALVEEGGARDTNAIFMNDLYKEVGEVLLNRNLAPQDAKDAIQRVIDRSSRQIAYKGASKITIEDHLGFYKWAKTAADGKVQGGEVQSALNKVLSYAAPKDQYGDYADVRDVFKELEAERFFWWEISRGATPTKAAINALARVGIQSEKGDDSLDDMQTTSDDFFKPFYPVGLPAEITLPPSYSAFTTTGGVGQILALPHNTNMWEDSHVAAAKTWVNDTFTTPTTARQLGRTARERRNKYVSLLADLAEISKFIDKKRRP